MNEKIANDDRYESLFNEMHSESDRGCILVGASVMDDLLLALIRKFLSRDSHVKKHAVEPLFVGMGPLSTFSARIRIAYCLGLIEKWEFEDLQRIRKIRNMAAHEYSSKSFEDPEIIKESSLLKAADQAVLWMKAPVLPTVTLNSGTGEEQSKRRSKERLRFSCSVAFIAGRIDTTLIEMNAIPKWSLFFEKVLPRGGVS
ncbi:MltR family transcriptional regulator [Denitratisoma sp. agr-D3]